MNRVASEHNTGGCRQCGWQVRLRTQLRSWHRGSPVARTSHKPESRISRTSSAGVYPICKDSLLRLGRWARNNAVEIESRGFPQKTVKHPIPFAKLTRWFLGYRLVASTALKRLLWFEDRPCTGAIRLANTSCSLPDLRGGGIS